MFSYISNLFYGKSSDNVSVVTQDLENNYNHLGKEKIFKNQRIIDEANHLLSLPKLLENNKKNGFFTEIIETKTRNIDGQLVQDYCETYKGEWYNDLKHGKGILEVSSIDEGNCKKTVYEGQFVGNYKHGFGIFKVNDEKPIEGVWFNNKLLECSVEN